ncbi:MAG: 2-amino-4-hydroxy-6-hydroxymethyldihydropteridine diphosphokinase [Litorivicinaceae bacterium]
MPAVAKTEVYLGLGANLANPRAQLERAMTTLAGLLTGFRVSPLYRSRPVGPVDQPDFINAVVCGDTALSPEDLLTACQAIEAEHGRTRTLHWGPRTLDIDILYYGDRQISTPRLQIPHPEAVHRGFVMIPLLDLRPKGNTPLGDPIERSRYDGDGLERLA